MLRRALTLAFLCVCVGCGDDGPGTPPTQTVSSVTVSYPGAPNGPIYIGAQTQFTATSTLSNGTTQVATNAAWGSDAPAVATVSATGLVNPLRAGMATIFADVNPRGVLLIRVFPNFNGTWRGVDTVTNCVATGAFVGVSCVEDTFVVGQTFQHDSRFTQTRETVQATIDLGEGTIGNATGNITVDGELQLPTSTVAIEGGVIELREWRSRSDEPSRMTGTYQARLTVPGAPGDTTISFRLDNVTRISTATALSLGPGGSVAQTVRRAAAQIAR